MGCKMCVESNSSENSMAPYERGRIMAKKFDQEISMASQKRPKRTLANTASLKMNYLERQTRMSELLPLKPDDFDQLKVIGKGAFSKVFLVRHRRTGLICAMKKINKQQVVESNCLDGMRTERELLARSIDFPFIVDLYFAFETVTHWYLCMEFCAGGEVYTLITHEGRWVEYPKVQHYAAELVLAIEWLHHHKFMHRDLKCENIMISQEGHTKLIDFGVSAGAMPVLTPAYKKLRKI